MNSNSRDKKSKPERSAGTKKKGVGTTGSNRVKKAKEAGLSSFQQAIQAIETADFDAAMNHQFKAVSHLMDFSEDRECGRVLILAALSLSDLYLHVRQGHDKVLNVLEQVETIAMRMGDERSRLLINLHRARKYQFINEIEQALELFDANMKKIDDLNDEDIRNQCAEFLGFYCILRGNYKEAIEHYEQAMRVADWREGQVFNMMIPVYSGGAASLLGQFYRGIGILDSQWRRALVCSNYQAARFLRALLSTVLLISGKKNEALVHLRANEEESNAHNDVWALVWTQRTLAYYYFLMGELQKSYKLLKESLGGLSVLGISRQYYGYGWILEMLLEFHKQGLASIPGYGLEQELEDKISGPNLILRGSACRIRAELLIFQNKTPARIEELLQKSEELLKTANAVEELGKTRIDLARLKLHQGDKEEAVELALKAREGLTGFTNTLFPGDLQMLIQDKAPPVKDSHNKHDILKRYFEIIEEFIPSPDQNVLFSRLISITSRLLEAERGAIFLLSEKGKRKSPVLQCAFNLTQEETQEIDFRSNLALIIRSFENNRASVTQLSPSGQGLPGQRPSSVLCLPFEMKNQIGGIMYYENHYSKGGFEFLSHDVLTQMSQNMSGYMQRIVEYCGREEKKTISVLRDSYANQEYYGDDIIAESPTMEELLDRADQAADSHAPVLILGDTGVGKGLLARRIHNKSSRQNMPLIEVNLASIPETLVESELFGHEKGAFTGAERQRLGRIELAAKGTLFVDEIGDVPMFVQVKILQALEEKAFFRVGGMQRIVSDFRLITATNKDLNAEVKRGRFREDLFYRLNVIPLHIKPLKHRNDDVVALAEHFLKRYADQYNRFPPKLTDDDKAKLKSYHWPGNVRELKNVIERSIVLATDERLAIVIPDDNLEKESILDPSPGHFSDLPTMEEMQRRYITYVAGKTKGKLGGSGSMAEILGMKRTTLQSRIKKLGI